MADRQKMDPVDLWMWIGAAVCLILSGAIALFLFGVVRFPGAPGQGFALETKRWLI